MPKLGSNVTARNSRKMSLPNVICIEGNIGSGKSTLLSELSAKGYTVVAEPICDIWGKYLPRLYKDINRWGFCFQLEVLDWYRQLNLQQYNQQSLIQTSQPLLSNHLKCSPTINNILTQENHQIQKRFSSDMKPNHTIPKTKNLDNNQQRKNDIISSVESDSTTMNKNTFEQKDIESETEAECSDIYVDTHAKLQSMQKRSLIIIERSAMSSLKIFAGNLLQNGNISEWEYSLLNRTYSAIEWQPRYILYLKCDASICIERIKMRNRNGENSVDIEFIESLHKRHELLLNHNFIDHCVNGRGEQNQELLKNQSVVIIDGSQDKCGVLQQVLSKLQELEENFDEK